MSLINEALKKAQKQRTAEEAAKSGTVPPPGTGLGGAGFGAGAPPPRRPAAPASGDGFEAGDGRGDAGPRRAVRARRDGGGLPRWAGPAGLGIVVLLVVAWWGLGGDGTDQPTGDPVADGVTAVATAGPAPAQPEPAAAIAAPAPLPTPGPPAAEPALPPASTVDAVELVRAPTVRSEPVAEAVSEPTVGASASERLAAAGASVPLAEAAGEVPARAAGGGLTILTDQEAQRSVRVVAAGGAIAPETRPAAAAAVRPQAAVLQYLERARVTGVRLSSTDPKVLFNDRVYRLNEIVDRDLQLRIIGIAERELQFRDPEGYVYTKRF